MLSVLKESSIEIMLKISDLSLIESKDALKDIPEGKMLINTINAHSYNVAQKDEEFAEALLDADYLLPDGAGVVIACRWLKTKSHPCERVTGWDLFVFEMDKLEKKGRERGAQESKPKVLFMGSSEKVLSLIRQHASVDYPNLDVRTYSPPYKKVFSEEDNQSMIQMINETNPDVLWMGMTAPKQERWMFQHRKDLDIRCHVGMIGAVFDFYAGTVKRAPKWWQEHSLEWGYRLLMEPKRVWRRYVLGNPLFIYNVLKEKFGMSVQKDNS